jgi:opacity protein-like surface antigen
MACALLANSLLAVETFAADGAEAGAAPQAEISALAGLSARPAASDANENPDGIGYGPGLQLSFQARGYVWSWLNAAIYHRRASHEIDLPRGAAGLDYEHISMDKVLVYSLGARLEPTYHVSEAFRTWVSVGVGWGRMTLGKVHVQESDRSYTVPDRAGVFVEVPLGLGASYEVVPRWLAVQAEADIAHLSNQSGGLHGSTPYVDSNGSLHFAGPMPTQVVSGSFLLGVSLLL